MMLMEMLKKGTQKCTSIKAHESTDSYIQMFECHARVDSD